MFTGIVQAICQIAQITQKNNTARLSITLNDCDGLQVGASVAVNGVCLTVVAMHDNVVEFDAISETLNKTNLGMLARGGWVNIERAARIGDEMGGHQLSGHITDTVKLMAINDNEYRFSCDSRLMNCILPKGFVALNGASLTLVDCVESGEFSVHLIPETLRATTFGQLAIGDQVNVELDHITQTIVATVKRCLRG